jgi:hypothetical protein
MARSLWRRLARLRARNGFDGDILPGEIVQALWGGHLGFVETISNDHATVFWHNQPGKREIICLIHLKRASADPAFGPDVRADS